MFLQDPDSTDCLNSRSRIANSQTISFPVICPKSGVIVLTSRDQNDVPFTAIRNLLQTESFTDQKVAFGPYLNDQGETSVVASFSISPNSAVSWTVTTTDPSVPLRLSIFPKGSCTSISSHNCGTNNYPCYFISSDLGGEYNLVVRDSLFISNPTPTNYNFTVSYILGNNQCRNITNDLDFCKGNLSTSDSYQLSSSEVQTVEQSAIKAWNTLSLSWSVDSCNESLVGFACKSSFQPHLCTSSGTLTKTYYCKQQCIDTLAPKCLSNDAPNFCELAACTTVSNDISACNTNTPPGPAGGERLIVTLFFALLSSYLLRMFN
jgi:hypothetical protein